MYSTSNTSTHTHTHIRAEAEVPTIPRYLDTLPICTQCIHTRIECESKFQSSPVSISSPLFTFYLLRIPLLLPLRNRNKLSTYIYIYIYTILRKHHPRAPQVQYLREEREKKRRKKSSKNNTHEMKTSLTKNSKNFGYNTIPHSGLIIPLQLRALIQCARS